MLCVFLGGPLDGELREVDWPEPECLYFPPEVAGNQGYVLANGIARHESVSEEEVARRVAGWRQQAARFTSYSYTGNDHRLYRITRPNPQSEK
jgi:hypothetical protein